MFQRFHKMREEDERGFTLIELLVVILIIAILAAIAIPVFLRQREKGWVSQMESALKNAATAEESYLTSNNAYTADVADLQAEGFNNVPNVTLSATANGGTSYCLEAAHTDHPDTYFYDSATGAPAQGSCP